MIYVIIASELKLALNSDDGGDVFVEAFEIWFVFISLICLALDTKAVTWNVEKMKSQAKKQADAIVLANNKKSKEDSVAEA